MKTDRAFPVLLLLLYLTGCRDDIITAPPIEYPFTLYGLLNPKADRQAIVVYPVQVRLAPYGAEQLDVLVTSTDLETGEVRVWADSVVSDEGTGHSHLFWSAFRPEFGSRYRIDVAGPDGAKSSALVRVPERIVPEIVDDGGTLITVRFPGGDFRLIRALLTYSVGRDPCFRSYLLDYSVRLRKESEKWGVGIRLNEYSETIASWLRHDCTTIGSGAGQMLTMPQKAGSACAPNQVCAHLRGLILEFTIAEEAWRPPLEPHPLAKPTIIGSRESDHNPLFDWDALSHQGVLQNVENGFGFVGGGYRERIIICPRAETILASGFRVPMNEECNPF